MKFFIRFSSLFIILFTYIYSYEEPDNIKSFFPKPNLTVMTPSIYNDHFTTQREMLDYLGKVHKKSSHTSVDLLGPTPQGNYLPLFLISKNRNFSKNKLTIMLVAQQHGDEPMGSDVLMGTIKRLATGDLTYLLDKLNFVVLPRVNPDGAQNFTRTNDDKIDINRDHTLLKTNEAFYVKRVFNLYSPEIFIDIHEYIADGHSYSKIIDEATVPYYDLLYLIPTNPNYPRNLRAYGFNKVLRPLQKQLKKQGYSSYYYYNPFKKPQYKGDYLRLYTASGVPGIARNAYGLNNTLSFLIELRGKNIGMENIERRLESGVQSLEIFFKKFYEDDNYIMRLIKNNSFNPGSTYYASWNFKGFEDSIPLIGVQSNTLLKIPVIKYSLHSPKIITSRKNPKAYIIDSRETHIINILKEHNIKTQIVQRDIVLTVERFKPLGERYILVKENIKIKKGTFVVPYNNIFISALLDPESPESLPDLKATSYKRIYRYTGD